MTNQRTGNASIIFHNHPLCLPTVLYVGSVPVNEHRLVRVGHFKHHRPCYKLVKELTAQRLWDINHSSAARSRGLVIVKERHETIMEYKPRERVALEWFISHNR